MTSPYIFSCLSFLLIPFIALSSAQDFKTTPTKSSGYTCTVEKECWKHLNDITLNKKESKGIYQYCENTYENIKFCCRDPSDCEEHYGSDLAQQLKTESLSRVEESGGDILSCQLNQLSTLISSLSDIQSNVCNLGVENCEMDCENRLEAFKNYFRSCFAIPNKYSIDEVLEKAKNPAPNQTTDQKFCNEAMIRLAEKYKKQSLDKKSLLREDLKAKDIVRCEGIRSLKTAHYLNNFALSMCRQAQSQKMDEERRAKEEEEERLRKQKEEKLRAKEAEEQARLEKILAERQKKEADQAKNSKTAQKASTSKSHSASKSKNSKPAQKKSKALVSQKLEGKGKKASQSNQSLKSKKSKKSSKKRLSQTRKKKRGGVLPQTGSLAVAQVRTGQPTPANSSFNSRRTNPPPIFKKNLIR